MFIFQIASAQDSRNTIIREETVSVIVSANHTDRLAFAKGISSFIPVINISLLQRVMGDDDYLFPFAMLAYFFLSPVLKPRNKKSLYMKEKRSPLNRRENVSNPLSVQVVS